MSDVCRMDGTELPLLIESKTFHTGYKRVRSCKQNTAFTPALYC